MKWIWLAWLCGWLAACAPEPTLRIAVNPWPGYELLFIAEAQGYFQQEKVNVRLVEFMSLGDSRRAFERGQVNAMAASPIEMLTAQRNSGRAPRAVWVFDISNGADQLIVAPKIRSFAELAGHRIAIEPGTLNLVLLKEALKRGKLMENHVVLVPMAPNAMPAAWQRGEIDAAIVYPPTSSQLRASGQVLLDSRATPGMIVDVLAIDQASQTEYPQQWAAVLRALERARRYLMEHPRDALQHIATREHLSIAEAETAFTGLQLVPLDKQRKYLNARHWNEVMLSTAQILGQRLYPDWPEYWYSDDLLDMRP